MGTRRSIIWGGRRVMNMVDFHRAIRCRGNVDIELRCALRPLASNELDLCDVVVVEDAEDAA